MIYQDMKIQVHFRRIDESILKNDAARAFLRTIGYPEEEYFGVQIVESRRGEMAEPEIIPFSRPQKRDLERRLHKLETERKTMSLEEVAGVGEALASILFYGTVRDMLVRCIDYAEDRGEGLRLRLVLKDAETARLPWEYVYMQQVPGEKATWSGFLALNPHISIIRHEPMQISSRATSRPGGPLKIYVGFAEPEGVGQDLDEQAIQVNIQEALREEMEAGRIVLTLNDHLQVKHLDEVAGYDIFNFSGHGDFLTEDELAYYRKKYSVPDDAQTETEPETEQEAQTEPETEQQEPAPYLADRALLRAGFARRHTKTTPAQTETLAETEAEEPPETAQQAPPEDGALRLADRTALKTGFARRQEERAQTENQAGSQEDTAQGILVFEKPGGYPHFYPATNLAQRLKRTGISVVVMDSCYSAKSANQYKWTGMASAMIRVGIPAVLGMQYAFSDPAAREFWGEFYKAVAAGLSLDEAVSYGRQAIIDLEPEPSEENPEIMLTGQHDFGFPTLYMRYEDHFPFSDSMNAAGGKTSGLPETAQEKPRQLALLKDLVRQSQDDAFVFVYCSSKDSSSS